MPNSHYVKLNRKNNTLMAMTKKGSNPPGNGWFRVFIDKCIGAACGLNLSRKPVSLTIAHVTDMHLRTEDALMKVRCEEGIAAFKESLLSQNVDYILDTGDSLDGTVGLDTFAKQSALYNNLWGDIDIPRYTAIGNHDNRGNTKADLRTLFGIPANYYYQDLDDKWRVIVLDSTTNGTGTQNPYLLGATQTSWLADTLAASADKYVIIMTHVPILSVAGMRWYIYGGANPVVSGTWNLTVDQHVDVYGILELFRTNPCVKLALSGHEHVYDDCLSGADKNNVRFICNGAVGINWWQEDYPNAYRHTYQERGYGIIKLYSDGTVENNVIYF